MNFRDVQLAFRYAPVLLSYFEAHGLRNPRFVLYPDASGYLTFNDPCDGRVAGLHLACNELRTGRHSYPENGVIRVHFCDGLVLAAKDFYSPRRRLREWLWEFTRRAREFFYGT